jgi:hypothetical protein
MDATGRAIAVGSCVRIVSVESCASGLPSEDQARLRAIVGETRCIIELDRSGFVWLSLSATEASANFCLLPSELEAS